MKTILPFVVVFAISLGLNIYNISGPTSIQLYASLILISNLVALVGGTIILLAFCFFIKR